MRVSRQSGITGCHGDRYQANRLIDAARSGDLEHLCSLLSSGVSVDSRDEEDRNRTIMGLCGRKDRCGEDSGRSRRKSQPCIETWFDSSD